MHSKPQATLSTSGRLLILTAAFLGWMCAGFHLSITSVAMPHAVKDLLDQAEVIDRVQYDAMLKLVGSAKDLSKSNLPPADQPKFQAW